MKIYKDNEIDFMEVNMQWAKDVKMKILIWDSDGSKNIIMRLFSVSENWHTPRHTHDFEHVVKVIKNKWIYVDKDWKEHEIKEWMSLFVPWNELHQFKNPNSESLEFLCIIPNPEKNNCCIDSKKKT